MIHQDLLRRQHRHRQVEKVRGQYLKTSEDGTDTVWSNEAQEESEKVLEESSTFTDQADPESSSFADQVAEVQV